jgi:signal transduction histidine kinase
VTLDPLSQHCSKRQNSSTFLWIASKKRDLPARSDRKHHDLELRSRENQTVQGRRNHRQELRLFLYTRRRCCRKTATKSARSGAPGHIRDQGTRVRKDGSIFQAEVIITALRDSSGNLRGYSKVTRDITDQIRTREFEAEKIAAEKASKAKDDFLAALSHELRTPLTPALAAASYLADNTGKLPAEFAEDVKIIKRNVQLQARLIDDLLDLTRVTRGKLQLHLEPVDANVLVRDAVEIARSAILAKKLNASIELAAKKHHVLADPIRLQQVFWNLINNAVKFTALGGQTAIRTSNDARDHFCFEITDKWYRN